MILDIQDEMTYLISRVLNKALQGNYIALSIGPSWGLPIDCLLIRWAHDVCGGSRAVRIFVQMTWFRKPTKLLTISSLAVQKRVRQGWQPIENRETAIVLYIHIDLFFCQQRSANRYIYIYIHMYDVLIYIYIYMFIYIYIYI